MNRENDFTKFAILMHTIAEVCPGEKPSDEKVELYFRTLQDMKFETVNKRMSNHLRFNKFFPTICEIRQEADFEAIANQDYALIEDLVRNFLFPEFMQCGVGLIEDKLIEQGKPELVPLFKRWGTEIMSGRNPTATRAQFIKAHISEKKIKKLRQIESGESKQLEKTDKLIEGIGNNK